MVPSLSDSNRAPAIAGRGIRLFAALALAVWLSGADAYFRPTWHGIATASAGNASGAHRNHQERLLPAHCEREIDGAYEPSGPSMIGKLGDRFVLIIHCEGIHQIYVASTSALKLASLSGKCVRVRYRYAVEENPRTRCVRPPCPPARERVVEIIDVEEESEWPCSGR